MYTFMYIINKYMYFNQQNMLKRYNTRRDTEQNGSQHTELFFAHKKTTPHNYKGWPLAE